MLTYSDCHENQTFCREAKKGEQKMGSESHLPVNPFTLSSSHQPWNSPHYLAPPWVLFRDRCSAQRCPSCLGNPYSVWQCLSLSLSSARLPSYLLLCSLGGGGDGWTIWDPGTHAENVNPVPGFWFRPDSAWPFVSVSGVNWKIASLSFCLHALQIQLVCNKQLFFLKTPTVFY